MTNSPSIPAQPPLNTALDFVALREEGVRLLQSLSSLTWTDYNEHDPGVTTLEQLCYALTELAYRAEFSMQDLLAQPVTGSIRPHRHGMFIARRILPCNPVTPNDYRKLIVDRVEQVRNAWVVPSIPQQGSDEPLGLYDILVYAPELDGHCSSPESMLESVRRVYGRHRNLCEDLQSVRVLNPYRTAVHAEVSVAANHSPERVLASIFFELTQLLAPEIERHSLGELLAAGVAIEEIFNGPSLRRGFIRDQELKPLQSAIAVNELIRVIVNSAGVESVRGVTVQTFNPAGTFKVNDVVPAPEDGYLKLDSEPSDHGPSFTIHLFCNGSLYKPRPQLVARELRMLRAAYRREYPLALEYDEHLAAPKGTYRDLSSYYSIQNQYPGIYGIGSYGLSRDAGPQRRAQARQLKGYLLPFEQLMADYFAQLAHLGDLFTIQPGAGKTYFSQSLRGAVPHVGPLLGPGYEAGLKRIVEGQDSSLARRNRFLEFLLSLYASPIQPIDTSGCAESNDDEDTQHRLERSRTRFLHELVRSTRGRAAGVDYRRRPSVHRLAGMELKCRIEMGLEIDGYEPLYRVVQAHGVEVAGSLGDETFGSDILDPVTGGGFSTGSSVPLSSCPKPEDLPQQTVIPRGNVLSQQLVAHARDPRNLALYQPQGAGPAVLLWRSQHGDVVLATAPDAGELVREGYALAQFLDRLHRAHHQLYIVEHLLLCAVDPPPMASATADADPAPDKRTSFATSLALTAVVGLPHGEWRNRGTRTTVEHIIRENTPAHIVAEVSFVSPWRMIEFERLYWRWRTALYRGHAPALRRASARLRHLLEHVKRVSSVEDTH